MKFRWLVAVMSLRLGACGEPASSSATADSAKVEGSSKPATSSKPLAASSAVSGATPSATTTSSASTSALEQPLSTLFGAADRVEFVGLDLRAPAMAKTNDPKLIGELIAALGGAQAPSGGLAKCPTPTNLRFFARDKLLGSVGLCASAGLDEGSKSAARVDLPSGEMGGFAVADLAALRTALEAVKVKLP